MIGLTFFVLGASTPELMTSIQAVLTGSSGIRVAKAVGSNFGNILLILGVTAMIAPISVNPKAFGRDGAVVVMATLLCLGRLSDL